MNQGEQIIDYIKRFGSITSMDAFYYLGITKLSTRISELKKIGYEFDQQWVLGKNRFGKPIKYMQYFMAGDLK